MGGRAFLQTLPPNSFPRLHPKLYNAVKERLLQVLPELYGCVEVPPEAPEKLDHGDLDFVVALPLNLESPATTEDVKNALGATAAITLEGNRMSNYAIDVQVCDSKEQVESIVVFHGYGDLGIILFSLAQSYGLTLSPKGLKIGSPRPDPPVHLTSSPTAILDFFGLSMEIWKKGFTTQQAVFEFVASSRLFNPHRLEKPSKPSQKKVIDTRNMYRDFLLWAHEQPSAPNAPCGEDDVVTEALVKFSKKEEWDAMAKERYERAWIKENFNGKLVAEWTGLGWRGVKTLMYEIRKDVGGERMLVGKPIVELKQLTIDTKHSLGLS
ncbi:hypothetical protein SERLA73DRAFT_153487 [Serpula lacrymans var. lacrymans S7.3]|uniref:Uncharacterized protein n=2 Tax=Serpula lacrymans var. lacrymans TaxID=341189 RepID=F8PZT5_SERL3|nr:uncharacterized protein SERLADRAFT_409169 [Serpula lacrymans var. lacrymans S7.9]EGN98407.1 hypothetical protein SERLA73DRAFT_153487 [Serpula lacrymans var. lacrymans S7.3]EGO23960.1 hypothetical protein SERLADRAFT_409169 [Serpula lacrymans var. lacrymans S7.9]